MVKIFIVLLKELKNLITPRLDITKTIDPVICN